MPAPAETTHETLIAELDAAIEAQALERIHALVEPMHPAEIAHLIESLPARRREVVWEQLDPALHADVLAEAEDAVRASRMRRMNPAELAQAASELDTDDAADVLQDLPGDVILEVLHSMDAQDRARLQAALAYDEDSAGGLMNTDVLSVRPDVTLGVVQRYLRWRAEIPRKTNRLYVVDRDNRYLGGLRLADLLIRPADDLVSAHLDTDEPTLSAEAGSHEVAQLFEQRDLVSAAVLDASGHLLGRVTFDDVMDVIREEGDHALLNMAGVDEDEDLFGPVLPTLRRRALWLGINLATAFLASGVIDLFHVALGKVVALAVLMPVVASMGGIAGTQTITIVIRGMALGQVGQNNTLWLLLRELFVGALNGLMWALVVGGVAGWWFEDARLGTIMGAAMIINLCMAALAGATLPVLLRRLRIDPAVAGGVVLTTVTDVVGFASFLGLGTIFLLGHG